MRRQRSTPQFSGFGVAGRDALILRRLNEQIGTVVSHISDGGADRVGSHQLSGVRPQERQKVFGLGCILAEPQAPQIARQDHRHSAVDRRNKLVSVSR